MISKRGQVTIFIIIAILIVAVVAGFFFFRSGSSAESLPANIQPAYTSFLNCINADAETGIKILESQGGYIDLPEFEPGSAYMPFSSQLVFAGNPIPYWYYVSRNNIAREQIPSENDMEEQLELFIQSRITDCNLRDYYDQGIVIDMGQPKVNVDIQDTKVLVEIDMDMGFQKENTTASLDNHRITVDSELGKLYKSAKVVYEEEQETLFLEKYGIDSLMLYAPVDGAEITCAPLVWNANEIFDNIQVAIEENTQAMKSKGAEDDYFALNLPVEEDVRFLNSKGWPNSFEILPADSPVIIANAVGNQPGLGIMGFCYVPYHFVYNIRYPVLVQVLGKDEIFQFPMAVVIQGNNPRESLEANATQTASPELCKYQNTEIQVNTYDTSFDPIDADISYECLGERCSIGSTEDGTLTDNFPQCANGFVSARANGYKTTRYLFSTVQSGSVDIIMEKVYDTPVEIFLDGRKYNGDAIISIVADYDTKTISYPSQKIVSLGEGMHDIDVQIFSNSTITFGATTTEQCIKVPNGILGVVGIMKDKCFQIQVPEQVISNALSGGGNQSVYLLGAELANGKTLRISAESFPEPESIEQLSNNYLLFEESGLEVSLI